MPELIPQNEELLNQLSKQALRKLKQVPDPTGLYCLQLVDWALEEKELQAHDPRLRQFLENLGGEPPKDVMKFLSTDGEKNPVELLENLENEKNPEPLELVWRVTSHVDDRLKNIFPAYPKGAPLQ